VLLGYTQYAAGSATEVSTTSGTYADVDATNMVVTFTAPPSGSVIVQMTARAVVGGGAGVSAELGWNLRDGSSDVSGSAMSVIYAGTGIFVATRPLYIKAITGLTPGASYTWKLGHARLNSTTGTALTGTGGTDGPFVMEVWAVP
jgi:hypothetical protein